MIKLGDKVVEWDDNFKLFFTTKLSNPHYSPEIMGKTMIINYGVTQDGLANQLLNVVVAHERPDLVSYFYCHKTRYTLLCEVFFDSLYYMVGNSMVRISYGYE